MAKKETKQANDVLNTALTIPWGDLAKVVMDNKPVIDNAINHLKTKVPKHKPPNRIPTKDKTAGLSMENWIVHTLKELTDGE